MTTTTQPVPQSRDGIGAPSRWSKKHAFRSQKTKAEIKAPSLIWSKSNSKRYCHNLSLYLITYFLINSIYLVPEWLILLWKRKRYLKLWERWNANWWSIQIWELDHKEGWALKNWFFLKIYLAAPGLICDIRDLVPQQEIEPRLPALGAQSLSH